MSNARRILVVDDQPDLRDQLAKFIIRSTRPSYGATLAESVRARILGRYVEQQPAGKDMEEISYEVDMAGQGQEALEKVEAARRGGNPYWLIFLDMRMPPGWDGLETMQRVWQVEPKVQIVLCSAYSDYSWQEIVSKVGIRDNLMILKKPFDTAEVAQLALSLTEKWKLQTQQAEQAEQLERMNQELAQEVSERKTMTEALRYTRNYLNNVFRSLHSALISVSADGVVTQWNSAAERIAGVPADQAINMHIWDMAPFLAPYKESFDAVVASRRPREHREARLDTAEGEKYLSIFMSPLICDANEMGAQAVEGVVIRIDDVTESVKKDERLRQTQKMDMVGSLAAGLAHDFKNIIGGIESTVSSIRLSLQMTDDPDEIKAQVESDLNIIEESSRHGSEMVKQLLNLSRKEKPQATMASLDLVKTLENVANICRKSVDKSVDMELSLPGGEAMVNAFPSQIEQVLINLIVNASHAMTIMRPPGAAHGGTLSISLSHVGKEGRLWETYPDAGSADYWLTSVRDTGVGMDRDTIAKIFDPFFTTKSKGHGTGLGLSMVYNIVRQHGGFIEVDSEPGVGTTFHVYLPSAEAHSASTTPPEGRQDP